MYQMTARSFFKLEIVSDRIKHSSYKTVFSVVKQLELVILEWTIPRPLFIGLKRKIFI